MDEGRKRDAADRRRHPRGAEVGQYPAGPKVPATICAISDAVIRAEQILTEIDRRWPTEAQT